LKYSREQPILRRENKIGMINTILTLYVKSQAVRDAIRNEDAQDLIEYALVVSLIAFAAIAGMSTLAGDINNAFNNIGTTLTADV
jgi:pilus assembly protein Flp/PilA